MKTKFKSTITVLLIAMIFLTNCGEAPEKDIKSPEENVELVSEVSEEAQKNANEEWRTKGKIKWEKFRAESETIIDSTDMQMKELRKKIALSGHEENEKLIKELDSLELKNKILRDKLAQRAHSLSGNLMELNEWAKEKQYKFEEEVKHDMQEIENALKKIITPDGAVEDEF